MDRNNHAVLCDVETSALGIVDIQTHLTAVMPAKVLARLQRNAGLLVKAATTLRVPVFASEQYPQGLGNLEPDIAKLLPDTAKRYEKTCFSVTGAEGFLEEIASSGRKQIILAGIEAHICVLQTAFLLLQEGYTVFVVADAVCSRHRESYETALERLRLAGAVITDAESVIFEWMRDSRHPHFKELQGLIR